MTSTATPDPLLAIPSLPDGTRLLHIGPHKTGTTALQAAMWEARGAMLAQGVHPAGSYRNPVSAVRAVTAQPSSYTDRPPPMREWRALVREIDGAAEPHLVVSSEYFAHADGAAIRRIVADLDPARIQVAVTLRPLSRVIPSMWQQNVQAGQRGSLDRWLHQLFPDAPGASDANFWMLHRHHELVDRWAEVVGIERVTAVVVDDRDHAFVLRAFERLLGLRAGTLELVQDRTNRSLTWNEAEAVRAFNAAFRRAGLDRGLHARVMRYGAAQHLKRREPARHRGPDPPARLGGRSRRGGRHRDRRGHPGLGGASHRRPRPAHARRHRVRWLPGTGRGHAGDRGDDVDGPAGCRRAPPAAGRRVRTAAGR